MNEQERKIVAEGQRYKIREAKADIKKWNAELKTSNDPLQKAKRQSDIKKAKEAIRTWNALLRELGEPEEPED